MDLNKQDLNTAAFSLHQPAADANKAQTKPPLLFSDQLCVFPPQQRLAPSVLDRVWFSALTSSAVVHGAADPRAHRSKSSHREVGDVSGLKRQNARVKTQKSEFDVQQITTIRTSNEAATLRQSEGC